MELYEGECCWLATREVVGEGEGDDEEGDGEGGNEGYLSTRDNLNPHPQIDPSLGYMADYPPVGYQGYMPSAMHTTPTLRMMALLDHSCRVPLLYLMRRSLEVLRKFHWMILGGRFNQLSHVASPLLSKLGEY
ncbi:hypothetical protein Tco_0455370 [Tanacetum coccineum]